MTPDVLERILDEFPEKFCHFDVVQNRENSLSSLAITLLVCEPLEGYRRDPIELMDQE
jgi:hypothetical protein